MDAKTTYRVFAMFPEGTEVCQGVSVASRADVLDALGLCDDGEYVVEARDRGFAVVDAGDGTVYFRLVDDPGASTPDRDAVEHETERECS